MSWPNSLASVDVLIADGTQSVFHLKVVFKLLISPTEFLSFQHFLLIAISHILYVPEKKTTFSNINALQKNICHEKMVKNM